MGFPCSLSENKSPQVSRTLLSVLAVLNRAVVLMVSTRSPTSTSSSPFNSPLVTLPNAPITIGIIVTFMFNGFFQFTSKVAVLLFTSFQFYSMVSRDSKIYNFASSFFFCWSLFGLVVWPRSGDPFVWQSPMFVCVTFSRTALLGCAYTICWYGQI